MEDIEINACSSLFLNLETKREGFSNFETPVFYFYVLSEKEWIPQEIKSVHIGY